MKTLSILLVNARPTSKIKPRKSTASPLKCVTLSKTASLTKKLETVSSQRSTSKHPDWYHYHPIKWVAFKTIDPSTLSNDEKQRLWLGLKLTNPAKAKMITTDPVIQKMKAMFNAKVVFEENELNNCLAAANEHINEHKPNT